ncbi:MAG: hypothetical protein PF904_20860 [Kiritimatiellae bacterium]|jgi:hypothetical protein|nr:hypothetical protein [Kiritimatiellia bacterium]
MFKTLEATIGTDGNIHLKEPIKLPQACRAFITIVEEANAPETALLSEKALGKDWNRAEEEEAWSHLQ